MTTTEQILYHSDSLVTSDRQRFILRNDGVIVVTNMTGNVLDVVTNSDLDHLENPTLAEFASDWVAQWA